MPAVEEVPPQTGEESIVSGKKTGPADCDLQELAVAAMAFIVGCIFLYCLPKVVLVIVIAGFGLGIMSKHYINQ